MVVSVSSRANALPMTTATKTSLTVVNAPSTESANPSIESANPLIKRESPLTKTENPSTEIANRSTAKTDSKIVVHAMKKVITAPVLISQTILN